MNTVPTRCTGCMTGGHPPSERKKLGDNHYYHPRNQVQRSDLLVNRPALDTLRPSDAPNQRPINHHKEG